MALSVVQVKRARLSARCFVPHLHIQAAEGGPPVPFDLWDFQEDVLRDIETHERLIILKARQLGLSWETLAYMLWLTTCNRGQTALILNRGLRESIELLDRVRFMHRRMPLPLRPRLTKDVVDHLEFGDMASRIYSLPATEYAGSGLTAQFVMIDEWAKIRGIRKIMTSLLPTLSAGGKLVGISTAQGFHNPFAEEWRRAISGQGAFYPLFIPWDAHPGRDQAWYEAKRSEFAIEREFLAEFPGEWLDAFQLPGESVFRDEFDRRKHVLNAERDPKAKWRVVRGIDFGYHHGIHLWGEVQAERNVYVFAECHAQRRTTQAMMEEVVVRDAELGVATKEAPAGCDPAGKAQTSVATESDHFTVQRFGIAVMAAEVMVKDRVALIKQLLNEGRLHIHSSCEGLIEALEQAQWAKAAMPTEFAGERALKEVYEKDGTYDHHLDALGYMLINIFPTQGKGEALKTQGGGGPLGGGRYSGSEFG